MKHQIKRARLISENLIKVPYYLQLVMEAAFIVERGDGLMYSLLVPKENIEYKKTEIDAEINRLIDEYGNDVLRISYIYLKDKHRAEDAFQEVFLKVYKKYENFKGMSSEKTWIIRITVNVCKDFLRSSWIKRVFPSDNVRQENTYFEVEDKLVHKEESIFLFNEVMQLPPSYKDVIILHYYQGFNTIEIGKILGIKDSTVRTRLFRAREALRKRINGRIEYCD